MDSSSSFCDPFSLPSNLADPPGPNSVVPSRSNLLVAQGIPYGNPTTDSPFRTAVTPSVVQPLHSEVLIVMESMRTWPAEAVHL